MPDTITAPSDLATIHCADALHALTAIPDTSVDAVVTDPPYAIKRVPSKTYDRGATSAPSCQDPGCHPGTVCRSCIHIDRVAKFDQAAMLGQQSQNWHAKETHSRGYADNDPRQFQTWCELWLAEYLRVLKPGGHLVAFGGTRTWHRLATAAEDTGFEVRDSLAWLYSSGMPKSWNVHRALTNATGHHVDPSKWEGWGTTLKPAFEPIVLARRPLNGTMVENLDQWGIGPLNVSGADARHTIHDAQPIGDSARKWPTNVHLDQIQAARLQAEVDRNPANSFWVAKPNRAERVIVDDVAHPTVKPLDLMRRFVRLVTPRGGTVLDPFAGSGTTIEACLLEGVRAIGIERDAAYLPLIEERVQRCAKPGWASQSTPSETTAGAECSPPQGVPARAPSADTLF